jgi:hypothetical protein
MFFFEFLPPGGLIITAAWFDIAGDTPFALRQPSGEVDSDIVERATEALFQFVFSSCDRLDGRRHWTDCHEDTKAGFRVEAAAVLKAVWPAILMLSVTPSQVTRAS